MTKLNCPGCGKGLSIKSEHRGKKIKCPGCGQVLRISAPKEKTPLLEPVDAASDSGISSSPLTDADIQDFLSDAPASSKAAPRASDGTKTHALQQQKQSDLADNCQQVRDDQTYYCQVCGKRRVKHPGEDSALCSDPCTKKYRDIQLAFRHPDGMLKRMSQAASPDDQQEALDARSAMKYCIWCGSKMRFSINRCIDCKESQYPKRS